MSALASSWSTSPSSSAPPVVVCDIGTSTTRLGYAANDAPTFVLPSFCAWSDPLGFDTLQIGHAAHKLRHSPSVTHRRSLLDHGLVTDWNLYEEFWRQLFTTQLCVESSDVGVVLSEPAGVPPRQRETVAEILFESFGVSQLYLGSQALFALSSCSGGSSGDGDGADGPAKDTALVVHSGGGVTEIVPVVDGYALNGAARQFPYAGRDVTHFILDRLRKRGESVEADHAWDVAERIKKQYTYCCRDAEAEAAVFESSLPAHLLHHRELHSRTGQPYEVEVAHEQFLAAELFFQPWLLPSSHRVVSLPTMMSAVIWDCPVDCRRQLYKNVVLCGGNTQFPHLAKRLRQELRRDLLARAAAVTTSPTGLRSAAVAEYEVHVMGSANTRGGCGDDAVWRGGSRFGASERFRREAVTRAAYEETGSFCRSIELF